MGCGASTLDPEGAAFGRPSNRLQRYRIVRPFTDNSLSTKKPLDSVADGEGVKSDGIMIEVRTKQVGSKDQKIKEAEYVIGNGGKKEVGMKAAGEKKLGGNANEDREDHICNGPGSPSFREYCIHYDSGHSSFRKYSTDCDSGESTKNGRDFDLSAKLQGEKDSIKRTSELQRKEVINSNKELEKNDRIGRRFSNAIQKAMAGGKKSF